MPDKAAIIDTIEDFRGSKWDVREYRETPRGWRLAIGWLHGVPRGRGGAGGVRVVPTRELVDCLEAARHDPRPIQIVDLPIGRNTIIRLRKALGHDHVADRDRWWRDHADELRAMTSAEFARRHGLDETAVGEAYRRIFGERRLGPCWWRLPEAMEILQSDLPTARAAERLGRTAGAVKCARARLRNAARKATSSTAAVQGTNRVEPTSQRRRGNSGL